MAEDISSENVVAVTFTEDSNAYQALTLLKELDAQGQLDLQGGAVVTRSEDGHARHPSPGKVTSDGKREGDRRVEVSS
jgi:uncharacterized membrane protein